MDMESLHGSAKLAGHRSANSRVDWIDGGASSTTRERSNAAGPLTRPWPGARVLLPSNGSARLGTDRSARRAAVLDEIPDEPVHHVEVRTVDQLPADSPLSDQPRAPKILEMEGQRGWQQADPFTDDAGRQSLRALFDQQSINHQAMRVRKRTEGADHLMGLHIRYDITRTLVLSIDTVACRCHQCCRATTTIVCTVPW
jgi:hypothetical protein